MSRARLRVGLLLILPWVGLWVALLPSWRDGVYYQFGFLVPVLVTWFAFERTGELDRARRLPALGWIMAFTFGTAACGAGIGILHGADPLWRLPLWAQAGLATLVSGGVARVLGGGSFLRSLVGIWLLALSAVPLPSVIEGKLIQTLTEGITTFLAFSLNLAGYPVQSHGAFLIAPTGAVAVEETCSGMRSLQATLMIALFAGEWFRLDAPRRTALLGGGIAIALLGNLGRAAWLTWQHFHGTMNPGGSTHDLAGSVSFLVTALLLLALGRMLGKRLSPARIRHPLRRETPREAARLLAPALAAACAPAIASLVWFGFPSASPKAVRLFALPEQPPAGMTPFSTQQTKTSGLLRFDTAEAARWQWPDGMSADSLMLHYAAENPAGWSDFGSHHPEVCMRYLGMRLREAAPAFSAQIGAQSVAVEEFLFEDLATGQPIRVYRVRRGGEGSLAARRWEHIESRRRDWNVDLLLVALRQPPGAPSTARDRFLEILGNVTSAAAEKAPEE